MILDTNILLENPNLIKETKEKLIIPVTVLEELDKLKTEKYAAKEVIRQLIKNKDKFEIFPRELTKECNDNKIISELKAYLKDNDEEIFYTNDNIMSLKANMFNIETAQIISKENYYKDPLYLYLNNKEINDLYKNIDLVNIPDRNDNKKYNYILCYDKNNNLIDKIKYNLKINKYEFLPRHIEFNSSYFKNIKPKDEYQLCLFDSLLNDDITLITGAAGTGKTLVSLSYIMDMIEHNKYKKLVIFSNPVCTKDSVDLGFYPGTKLEKILNSSIGNILATKFESLSIVEKLIEENKIDIQPFSNIRGYEVKSNEILYISEMQNTSISLAKTALQRVQEGAKIIFEGDLSAQIDMINFEDSNNGLKRIIEVLNGEKGISHIKLQHIYRSNITSLAERL